MARLVERTRRALAIGAHPDDLEVGAGGLIARIPDAVMVVASVPNRFDERLAEARAGAARLGARLVTLGDATGPSRIGDRPTHALVADLAALLDEHQPDLVITHAGDDLHADHVAVHRATIAAMGERRTRCDVLAYHASPDLAAIPRRLGPCFADVTQVIDTKLAAIAAHATQFPTAEAVEARREHARVAGLVSGTTYAESFDLLRLYV